MQGNKAPGSTGDESGFEPPSLRRRMETTAWLMVTAGILSIIGFVMVAVGVAQGFVLLGTQFGSGIAFVSDLVPWGVAFVGFGVMLGFFGAAIKGPSMEWRDIAPETEALVDTSPRPPGMRYACPGCGGDVYMGQGVCPACGQRLPGIRMPMA